MKIAAVILAFIGLALAAFGWWGMYTRDGRDRFDEMDGLYPFFAGLSGLAAILGAVVLVIVAMWRGR